MAFATCLFCASISWGGEAEKRIEPYPNFLRIYKLDGRESLTGSCSPTGDDRLRDWDEATRVLCEFVHVRFHPSAEKPDSFGRIVSTLERAGEQPLGRDGEELKDPVAIKKARDEWRETLEGMRQTLCSRAPGEPHAVVDFLRKTARNPAAGPKRRRWGEEVMAACSEKDPIAALRKFSELEGRTCDLWVDSFELEFQKVGDGQWIFRQDAPSPINKVLKVYELTRDKDGYFFTLTETRVPTKGSDEKPSQTVWNTEGFAEYELPCDFVSHGQVKAR